METYLLKLSSKDSSKLEIAQAWFGSVDVDGMVEYDDYIEVYFSSEILDDIQLILDTHFSDFPYSIELNEEKNWNEVWEASFNPIEISDIYVRAEFHPKRTDDDLVIRPKMAFGTGHHETTFMMLDCMQNLDFKNKSVLDYGCGTGILAVYAAKKGADQIVCLDIQPEAIENTIEHFQINGLATSKHSYCVGDLEDLNNDASYDVILANINKSVIEKRAKELFGLSQNNGLVLVSGILKEYHKLIVELYANAGFKLLDKNFKGEWSLMLFKKFS